MNDVVKSISTIKNFMGNASRTTCNEYLYEALTDAVESMERDIPTKLNGNNVTGQGIRCECGFFPLYKSNYCSRCGKAIDWEEKDENSEM